MENPFNKWDNCCNVEPKITWLRHPLFVDISPVISSALFFRVWEMIITCQPQMKTTIILPPPVRTNRLVGTWCEYHSFGEWLSCLVNGVHLRVQPLKWRISYPTLRLQLFWYFVTFAFISLLIHLRFSLLCESHRHCRTSYYLFFIPLCFHRSQSNYLSSGYELGLMFFKPKMRTCTFGLLTAPRDL